MRNFLQKFLHILLLSSTLAFTVTANAQSVRGEVTLKDVQTVSRVLGFLEDTSFRGDVIAVVYNPASSSSRNDAVQAENIMKKESGGLVPVLVPVTEINNLQGADLAFVTEGLQGYYESMGRFFMENSILSFTLDKNCAYDDFCSVYINTAKRVEIVVNKDLTENIGAKFKSVFLILVTVI